MDNKLTDDNIISPPAGETSKTAGEEPTAVSSGMNNATSPFVSSLGEEESMLTPEAGIPPPQVIVPSQGGVPAWFYFLFGITVLTFFGVTAILIYSFMTAGRKPPEKETGRVVYTVFSPTPPVPTATFTQNTVEKLTKLTGGDQISDINTDLQTTDFSAIDVSLNEFEAQAGIINQ